ncbi:MAG: twin-arginine translocation signal domain-containing protein, partial [Planctomycetota bacterium]
MSLNLDRRQFLGTSAAVALGAVASSLPAAEKKRPKLRIAVKHSMIGIKGDELAKMELLKKVGFQGVEIGSPSEIDLPALKAACEQTGIVMHGSIGSLHWSHPLSDP